MTPIIGPVMSHRKRQDTTDETETLDQSFLFIPISGDFHSPKIGKVAIMRLFFPVDVPPLFFRYSRYFSSLPRHFYLVFGHLSSDK